MSRRVGHSAIKECLFYFTCGSAHSHLLPAGLIWDKSSVLEVLANSLDDARALVVKYFGLKWAFSYETKHEADLSFYPAGVIGWRKWQRQYEDYLPFRYLAVGDMVFHKLSGMCFVVTPELLHRIIGSPKSYSLPPVAKADESADYEALYRVIMDGVPPGKRVVCLLDNTECVRDVCALRNMGGSITFGRMYEYGELVDLDGFRQFCEVRRVRWYLLKDVV